MSFTEQEALRAASLKKASADMLEWCGKITAEVRTMIASDITTEMRKNNDYFAQLIATSRDGFCYIISFHVEKHSYRSYPITAVGARYNRDGRNVSPRYALNRDGKFAVDRMAADIGRAIVSQRNQRERHAAIEERCRSSKRNLRDLAGECGLPLPAGPSLTVNSPLGINVRVDSGNYVDGKLEVTLSMKDRFISKDEVLALLKALGAVK